MKYLAVYTSYDYGSPITEAGLMTPKAYEIKLQGNKIFRIVLPTARKTARRFSLLRLVSIGAFLRDIKPFVTTTNTTAEVDNDAIRVDGIKDISGNTTFYIVQHVVTNTTSVDK